MLTKSSAKSEKCTSLRYKSSRMVSELTFYAHKHKLSLAHIMHKSHSIYVICALRMSITDFMIHVLF